MSSIASAHRFGGIRRQVGGTPALVLRSGSAWLVSRNKVFPFASPIHIPNENSLVLKLEHLSSASPSGSMHDRLYWWLFRDAERRGLVDPERTHVVECSVGNAGAAFAYVARTLGYDLCTVILPEDIYPARIEQVRKLGAEILFSPPAVGPRGYIAMIEDYLNEHRWRRRDSSSHVLRLCPISKIRRIPVEPYGDFVRESLDALRILSLQPRLDAFVSVVGAGNTISMVGRYLRSINPRARVVVAEHRETPFVSLLRRGKQPPLHGKWSEPDYPATTIHGIPLSKMNLDLEVISDVVALSRDDRDCGISVLNDSLNLAAGRPAGAAFAAALDLCHSSEACTFLIPIFDSVHKYAGAWRPLYESDIITGLLRRMPHVA